MYPIQNPVKKALIRLIVRGKLISVAKYCVSNETYRQPILTILGKVLEKEVQNLCSDDVQSIL